MAKAARPGGFGERSQRAFEPASAALDPKLAEQLGVAPTSGASATVAALSALIESGRPEVDGQVWTPHRPPRPEKSEGGVKFVIKSDYTPNGDQPAAIEEL
ncbi:MAG: excinuclease ABC subunit UvrB, partial [Xanthobacteraceae bacterium]